MKRNWFLIAACAAVAVGVIRPASAARSIPIAVPEKDADANRLIRLSMGFSEQVQGDDLVDLGPVRLNKTEAAQFSTLENLRRVNDAELKALAKSEAVISVSFDPNIPKQAVDVWMHGDLGESVRNTIAQVEKSGLSVVVREVPFSKTDYVTARDFFARQSGIDVDPTVDIDGRRRPRANYNEVLIGQLKDFSDRLAKDGVEIDSVGYPERSPHIAIRVDAKRLREASNVLPIRSDGLLVVEASGGRPRQLQAAGPWFPTGPSFDLTGRNVPGSIGRGGKRVGPGLGDDCSSGPVVRDQWGNDYMTTAGHCLRTHSTLSFSGATGTLVARCDTIPAQFGGANQNCLNWLTFGGVDVAFYKVSPGSSATGWFVHQAWPGNATPQTTSYTAQTVGSFDLVGGLHLICEEGASQYKVNLTNGAPPRVRSAASSCGISLGFNSLGLYEVTVYPYQPVCQGDSGAYVRRPNGDGTTSNAGHLSVVMTDATNISDSFVGGGPYCWMRPGDTAPLIIGVNTFWKSHLWLSQHSLNFPQQLFVWAKTW